MFLVFYFNMEPRLKWNKNALSRGSMLKYNYCKEFQTWAAAVGRPS